MRRIRQAVLPALVLALALTPPSRAQDDGGGMIQRFLQDQLSSAGRDVTIRGFEGLLGGEAKLAELTIADDDGVWLVLKDAVLDWNRAALLRGNLTVNALTAAELDVRRKPVASTDTGAETPKAEASGFALPELPVAIRIDKLAIERAVLGETLLGQSAVLSLDGSVQLAGGEGSVDISTDRIDRPGDQLSLEGSFVNESRELTLNLDLEEEQGGLVTSLLNLPGAPSMDLNVTGAGPLSDFSADIALRTDGQDRISGNVSLQGAETGGTNFAADIGGDITPILPSEFHDFFGDDVRLIAQGNRGADGNIDLADLSIGAQSLELKGSAQVGADGIPTAFALNGRMANSDGGALRLPVAGPGVFVESVTLDAAFDSAQSDRWTLDAMVDGLDTDAATVGSLELNGVGTITPDPQAVTADLLFEIGALNFTDSGLTEALGSTLSGGASLAWQAGNPLDITRLYADGEDYSLSVLGDARISGRSMQVSGEGRLRADDLSRFSTISGQTLTGRASADVSGQGDVLGGQFAVTLDLEGDDLSIGQETVDRLLTEPVTLSAAARRDTSGTTLDKFELRSRAVSADASGKVGSGSSDLSLKAALSDIGLVMPGQTGAASLEGTARETAAADWQVGLDLDGPWDLTGSVDGRVKPGASDVTLDLTLPDIAPLVPDHSGAVTVKGQAKETGSAGAWGLDLAVTAPYDLTAGVKGTYAPGATDVDLKIDLPDIAPLVPGREGAVSLTGNAAETQAGGWTVKLDGSGPYDATLDLAGDITPGAPGKVTFSAGLPDISPLVPNLDGPVSAKGTASDAGDGLWQVDFDVDGPLDGTATVDGVVGGGQSDLKLDISIPDVSPVVPQLSGALEAKGTAKEAGDGRWNVDFDLDGPEGATVALSGAVGATGTDVDLALDVPDISPLVPGHSGALSAQASAAQGQDGTWDLSVDATGPYRSTIKAGGTYGTDATDLTFDAALPDIAPLASGLSGPLSLKGSAKEAGGGDWDVNVDASGPYNATADVSGTLGLGTGTTSMDLTVSVPSVSPFAPGVTGGVQASGTVGRQGAGDFTVDFTSTGPEGVSSAIKGTVAGDASTMNLTAVGSAPLGIANRFISPSAVLGTAQFDLAIDGAPALSSVSGTVNVAGARVTVPGALQTLDNIGVRISLSGETMQIDASADGPDGGSLGANGSIQLTGGFNADLRATLNQLVLFDPLLYRTSVNGNATITGPLTGGASIDGGVQFGRTEVQVPDGSLGYGGTIPDITHVNEPANVFLTRERAGLVDSQDESKSGGGGGGPVYNLNVQVTVPGRIFVRGRGLDVEMGGSMRVTGTTAAPNPVGEIDVIRGRLDILGKRLDVTEGSVSLAGGLQPYIDLSATSRQDDFEFIAQVTGPVDDPTFDLTSVPSLPEDEVLAQFLFGQGIDDLSPLQAVQLANALATLTGRGGIGVLGGIRQGLGLDDLDLETTADGGTEVRAGKYISENVYTEFVAGSDGDSELDINIDVTGNFTVKGSTTSSGESSIGIFWERDY